MKLANTISALRFFGHFAFVAAFASAAIAVLMLIRDTPPPEAWWLCGLAIGAVLHGVLMFALAEMLRLLDAIARHTSSIPDRRKSDAAGE